MHYGRDKSADRKPEEGLLSGRSGLSTGKIIWPDTTDSGKTDRSRRSDRDNAVLGVIISSHGFCRHSGVA